MSNFRKVNKSLDLSPRIGPFPAEQFIPWLMIGVTVFFLGKRVFDLPWLWVIILIIWGCSTWWVITAGGYYKFFSKFIEPPHWVRGMGRIQPLLSLEKGRDYEQNRRKNC
ncbi:MAG: hypothetical protein AB4060_19435 [Crocosphaera sp.]